MRLGRGADALGVGAAKLAVSALVLALGFRAVSDDDYARIVIAERFAEAPRFDASGTSWLPLPFWLYGSAFRLLGSELWVARGVALTLGVGATLSVWVSATWLGASRLGAFVAALLAAAFPWSAWLGAAPLPEAPAAGLTVLALASLAGDAPVRRWLGALAVAAAALCRYEAWPIAVLFAGFSACDALRARSAALLAPPAVGVAPLVAWLAHGATHHADALFFWRRVASYRQALGPGEPLAQRLAGPILAFMREEPGLVLALVLVAASVRPLARHARPWLGAALLLAFLTAGELGGGGPTHHLARAILPVWYLVALLVGDAVGRRAAEHARAARAWLALPFAALVASWVLLGTTVPASFVDRRDALDIGGRARLLGAPALFIDTLDYAHLAVAAAFGRPDRAEPFDDRDPRKPRVPDAFASPATLRKRLARAPLAWLVVTRAHLAPARELGRLRAENQQYGLIEPGAPSSR